MSGIGPCVAIFTPISAESSLSVTPPHPGVSSAVLCMAQESSIGNVRLTVGHARTGGMATCPSGRQRWQGAAALSQPWHQSRRLPTRVACLCHAWSSATRQTCEVSVTVHLCLRHILVQLRYRLPAHLVAHVARCGRQGHLGYRADQELRSLAGAPATAI